MSFRLKVLQDVLKVEFLAEVKLWRKSGKKAVVLVQGYSSGARSDIFLSTYMGILLVQLSVPFLQDVIWVANVFFDCHGLHESTHR